MSIEYFLHGLIGAGARGGEESRLSFVLREGYRVVVGLLRDSVNRTVVGPHDFIRPVRGAVAEIVLPLERLRPVVVVGGDRHQVRGSAHQGVTHILVIMHIRRFHRIGRAVRTHQWNVRHHI